jgi:ribosomal protein L7Ae-like RNA K-turn-binding protein
MAQTIPLDHATVVLEAQIRESFGRVVYTHKTYEKSADITLEKLGRIKLWQITLSAVTTGGIVAAVFSRSELGRWPGIVAAIVSTILLALNAYTKDTDLGQLAQKQKEAADKLWNVRESYLSLLADLAGGLPVEDGRRRRDELQQQLLEVYSTAPRTTATGYARASKGLKEHEELTFSDEEIDKFLPEPLRKIARAN